MPTLDRDSEVAGTPGEHRDNAGSAIPTFSTTAGSLGVLGEMVERVARAMCVANSEDPDRVAEGERFPAWELYGAQARAAIEAMREPTEAMISVCIPEGFAGPFPTISESYRAMIDEALK